MHACGPTCVLYILLQLVLFEGQTYTRSTRSPSPSFTILHPNAETSSQGVTTPATLVTTEINDLVVNTSVISGEGSGSERCKDEIVCLTLDVSGSMGVSLNSWYYITTVELICYTIIRDFNGKMPKYFLVKSQIIVNFVTLGDWVYIF